MKSIFTLSYNTEIIKHRCTGLLKRLALPSLLSITAFMMPFPAFAQDPIVIEPLFEYPVAPDELDGLQERSDYLVGHFWEPFDFSRSMAVDQNALNDAFNVYVTTLRFAERSKALDSVDKLIKKLKDNPVLLLQFTKSAEESLYGPRAMLWSDEAYMPFLKAVVADKKLSDTRKQRYAMQLDLLKRNAIGAKFPAIRLTLRNGRHLDYVPKAPLTLMEFGNPDCDDCKFSRTKLDMAVDVADMIESKELDMVFIVADAVPEEQSEIIEAFSTLPETWTPGICYGGDDIFDLRVTPSFYIIDKDGRIIAKNLDVMQAVDRIREIRDKNSK